MLHALLVDHTSSLESPTNSTSASTLAVRGRSRLTLFVPSWPRRPLHARPLGSKTLKQVGHKASDRSRCTG